MINQSFYIEERLIFDYIIVILIENGNIAGKMNFIITNGRHLTQNRQYRHSIMHMYIFCHNETNWVISNRSKSGLNIQFLI